MWHCCVISEYVLIYLPSLQLMLACWMTDPDERPTAEELNLMLADLARGGGTYDPRIDFLFNQ